MNAVRHLFGSLLLLLVSLPVAAQSKSDADYQAMLGWLASSRIEGNALSGTSGAVAVNQAAGDNNLQGNLRAVAVGEYADTRIQPLQRSSANTSDTPRHAEAFIGEGALARSSGLVSINQASGSDNIELNTVALALAQRGIREADDGFLSASGVASAEVQNVSEPGGTQAQTRKVGLDASALRGFEGVLQLNQVAGGRNATENRLQISVLGP